MQKIKPLPTQKLRLEIESFNNAVYNKAEGIVPKTIIHFSATNFAADGINKLFKEKYNTQVEHIGDNNYKINMETHYTK